MNTEDKRFYFYKGPRLKVFDAKANDFIIIDFGDMVLGKKTPRLATSEIISTFGYGIEVKLPRPISVSSTELETCIYEEEMNNNDAFRVHELIHKMIDICSDKMLSFSRRDTFNSTTFIIKDGEYEVVNITCPNKEVLKTAKDVYDKLMDYIKDPVNFRGEEYLNQVKKSFNTHDFFKELFEDIEKFPFFAEKMPFDTDTYYTPKKVREYLEKIQGQSVPRKEAEEIVNGGNDGHEIGGTHYKMAIEPWDYIQANGLGFDEGNIVKYASRHKQKNGAEDIKKIISYAKHILKTQYGEDDR